MIKYNLIKGKTIEPIIVNNSKFKSEDRLYIFNNINIGLGGINNPTQKLFINKKYGRDDLITACSYALMSGQKKYNIGVDPYM